MNSLLTLGALAALSSLVTATTETDPNYVIRDKTPTLTAFINAKVYVRPGEVIDSATIVVEAGVIRSVGKGVSVPAGARTVDLGGKTVYPGFIDAFADYGVEQPEGNRRGWREGPKPNYDRVGGDAWNGAIHSEHDAISEFKPSAKTAKSYIESGFTVVQSARLDGIFRGESYVVTLGDDEPNDVTLRSTAHQYLSFDKGSSEQDYPNSRMGAIALLRQTFMDVDWYTRAQAAYKRNPAQDRPEYNAALAALSNMATDTFVFESNTEYDLLRADKVAKEFKLNFIQVGSGLEYMRIPEIGATGSPIILPVDFPGAPEVGTLDDALDVSLATLRHWETAPSNPARLANAGITFAFTTHRLEKKGDFWGNVRKAVRRGLSKETALAALTTVPAELCGITNVAGTITGGKLANFVVTDGDIFDKKTKIQSVYISGKENRIEDKPPTDVRGIYSLHMGELNATLKLIGEIEKVSGSFKMGDSDQVNEKLSDVSIEENQIQFRVSLDTLGFDGVLRFSARKEGSSLIGKCVYPDGAMKNWSAELAKVYDSTMEKSEKKRGDKDKEAPAADTAKGDSAAMADKDNEKGDDADEDKPEELVARLTYPNIAYGYETPPAVEDVFIKNATIWTCDTAGIIEGGSMLVRNGKISSVGKNLTAPSGVRVIDAKGMHLTPGIIDEHSHICIDGGVNECTETITAEVRIGDVVNPDDISMYRQLSGGVVCAQLLHGSCNAIGGQAQVIKFRWGSTPEGVKYKLAPPSIKFALGENVKRSNFGDAYTVRYPQTRMGVETIVRDGFTAAQEYKLKRDMYNSLERSRREQTVPPRKDIEMEALLDIIESRMFIHCHSYVQSEILSLMLIAEDFGFHVQTFTHILEGYKVADEMARHGAGASSFADWWDYKFEVYDAIPYSPTLMTRKGVVTSVNSDDSEMARRLNQEAGKSVMYGGLEQEEALKLCTINPAKQLRIDKQMGSLTPGKDADFVLWTDNPLSVYATVDQTWVEGRNMFSKAKDLELRQQVEAEKNALIQKAIKAGGKGKGSSGRGGRDSAVKAPFEWHCEDVNTDGRIGQ